jgi:tetratricopeptide (TPR) repeat protein
MQVELHSLSRDELNGRHGEAFSWNGVKERWVVHLAGGDKMAVRPIKLRRAPPAPVEAGDKAIFFANKAIGTLAKIREVQGPQPQDLFGKAERFLLQAEEQDPGSVLVHSVRGDAAKMRGQYTEQVRHMRRAVANGLCLLASDGCCQQNRLRIELAIAIGSAGDRDGEIKMMRTVLVIEPENIFARLMLGQSLHDRGDYEAAVRELTMALQTPNEAKPPWPKLDAEKLRMCRHDACYTLRVAFSRRAEKLSAQGDHLQATELLSLQVLQLPGIDAGTAAIAHANLAKSYVVLGELDKAEWAITTARELPDVCTLHRAFVLSACGQCKELEADAARASGAAVDMAALYRAAKEAYYKQAMGWRKTVPRCLATSAFRPSCTRIWCGRSSLAGRAA